MEFSNSKFEAQLQLLGYIDAIAHGKYDLSTLPREDLEHFTKMVCVATAYIKENGYRHLEKYLACTQKHSKKLDSSRKINVKDNWVIRIAYLELVKGGCLEHSLKGYRNWLRLFDYKGRNQINWDIKSKVELAVFWAEFQEKFCYTPNNKTDWNLAQMIFKFKGKNVRGLSRDYNSKTHNHIDVKKIINLIDKKLKTKQLTYMH